MASNFRQQLQNSAYLPTINGIFAFRSPESKSTLANLHSLSNLNFNKKPILSEWKPQKALPREKIRRIINISHFNVVSDLTLYSQVENISINRLPVLYKNLNKL